MYVLAHVCFYVCCSDYVVVCGNVRDECGAWDE